MNQWPGGTVTGVGRVQSVLRRAARRARASRRGRSCRRRLDAAGARTARRGRRPGLRGCRTRAKPGSNADRRAGPRRRRLAATAPRAKTRRGADAGALHERRRRTTKATTATTAIAPAAARSGTGGLDLDLVHALLGAALHVGLGAERSGRVTEIGARLVDLAAQVLVVTVPTLRGSSPIGRPPWWNRLPVRARAAWPP